VVTDDALSGSFERPFITLGGDIAVIASGGGASMLNIDILMRSGGKPANYVEYSGNPPAALVEELTMQVLFQPDLRGAWVIGGTANFTDIYETMSGFVAGLRKITPKPTYPIVIRRDGPRQEEARAMLQEVAKNEGFNMHVFGSEISMAESAKKLIALMEKNI
jgi:succinyl-CoA synthetase beta subunit